MAFWSGETLLWKGKELFEPFDKSHIDCNSYSLCMGSEYYKTADGENSPDGGQRRISLGPRDTFIIPAGQFAFLLSKEIVKIPNYAMAFISMRTTIKFKGLINVSGFHVDPGYCGKLIYAVYNASPSPIEIREGESIFKIWFCSLNRASSDNYIKSPSEGLNEISGHITHGMSKEILSLQNLSKKIGDLDRKVENKFSEQKPIIDNLTFVWRAITLGVVGAFILFIFAVSITWSVPIIWNAGKHMVNYINAYSDN